MYDPSVVETFIRIYKSIAPKERDAKLGAISAIMASEYEAPPTPSSPPSAKAVPEPNEINEDFAAMLGSDRQLPAVGDKLAHHLRRLFPLSLCVYYAYEPERDELVARYASGNSAGSVVGHRIISVSVLPGGWRPTGALSVILILPWISVKRLQRSNQGREAA